MVVLAVQTYYFDARLSLFNGNNFMGTQLPTNNYTYIRMYYISLEL